MKKRMRFYQVGHWPTLLSAFLYFDVSFMVWVLFGALGNHVAAEFGLGPAQKGLMTALPLLGGSLLRLLFGYSTDRLGAKWTACLGMATTLLPLLAGWLWVDSLPKLYLVGLLLGVAGASFAAALPLASRWYPSEHQGLALGIAGAGNSGTLLATFFAPRLAETLGWRAVFGLAMIPIALVAAVLVTCAKEAPGRGTGPTRANFTAVLKQPDTYWFSLFYGVTFGGFVGLASFLAVFLHDQYGVAKVRAGDLVTLCVFAGSFLRPVGGWLADRWGGFRMLMLLYVAILALAFEVAAAHSLATAVTLLFLLMASLGLGNGSVFELVPLRYREDVGVATGILGAAGGLGGFLLPMLLGSLKQLLGSYAAGFMTLGGLAGAALLGVLIVSRRGVRPVRPTVRPAVGLPLEETELI